MFLFVNKYKVTARVCLFRERDIVEIERFCSFQMMFHTLRKSLPPHPLPKGRGHYQFGHAKREIYFFGLALGLLLGKNIFLFCGLAFDNFWENLEQKIINGSAVTRIEKCSTTVSLYVDIK